MTMGSVSHVKEGKKDLVIDVHRFARLVVRLEDSLNVGFIVHHNSESPWWLRCIPNNTLVNY